MKQSAPKKDKGIGIGTIKVSIYQDENLMWHVQVDEGMLQAHETSHHVKTAWLKLAFELADIFEEMGERIDNITTSPDKAGP